MSVSRIPSKKVVANLPELLKETRSSNHEGVPAFNERLLELANSNWLHLAVDGRSSFYQDIFRDVRVNGKLFKQSPEFLALSQADQNSTNNSDCPNCVKTAVRAFILRELNLDATQDGARIDALITYFHQGLIGCALDSIQYKLQDLLDNNSLILANVHRYESLFTDEERNIYLETISIFSINNYNQDPPGKQLIPGIATTIHELGPNGFIARTFATDTELLQKLTFDADINNFFRVVDGNIKVDEMIIECAQLENHAQFIRLLKQCKNDHPDLAEKINNIYQILLRLNAPSSEHADIFTEILLLLKILFQHPHHVGAISHLRTLATTLDDEDWADKLNIGIRELLLYDYQQSIDGLQTTETTQSAIQNGLHTVSYFQESDIKPEFIQEITDLFVEAAQYSDEDKKTLIDYIIAFALQDISNCDGEIRSNVFNELNEGKKLDQLSHVFEKEHIHNEIFINYVNTIIIASLNNLADHAYHSNLLKLFVSQSIKNCNLSLNNWTALNTQLEKYLDNPAVKFSNLKKHIAELKYNEAYNALLKITNSPTKNERYKELKKMGANILEEVDRLKTKESAQTPGIVPKLSELLVNTAALLCNPSKTLAHKYQRKAEQLTKISWGKVVGGIMLALAGAVVVVLSATIAAASFGLATPFSIFSTGFGVSTAIGGLSTAAAAIGLFGMGYGQVTAIKSGVNVSKNRQQLRPLNTACVTLATTVNRLKR